MPSSGPNYCASAVTVPNVNGYGNTVFNPQNIEGAPDGTTTSMGGLNVFPSDYVELTDWGFTGINTLAQITRVQLDLYAAGSNNVAVWGSLILNGSPIHTDEFTGMTEGDWPLTQFTFLWANKVFGSDMNVFFPPLWDYTASSFLLGSDVSKSNFGCRLMAAGNGSNYAIQIDSARMTIFWTDDAMQLLYAKKIRKFKFTRNHQTKIVSQVKFKGAA